DIDFSFEGNERMSCEYQGEDIQIAFNAKFLIEMLNAADTDEVFIASIMLLFLVYKCK
ncbi:MAG: polymerase subunit beta, partial [Bacteroidota bacterium]